MEKIDNSDLRILQHLQLDADQSLDALAEAVALSRNAVWRRIKSLEARGIIRSRVALLDAHALGLGLTVFLLIRTASHTPDWLERFARATRDIPEIMDAYRMTGDLDYLVRARIADVAAYDALYRKLIDRVEIADVSASFVMEELKESTALPL